MKDTFGWDAEPDTSAPDDTPTRKPGAGRLILLALALVALVFLAVWRPWL